MPNPTQNSLLNDFIGDNGIYFESVKEYPGLDVGTKVLYLQRAINEDCQIFLQSLDKLYQSGLTGDAKPANLELIRGLKCINDFCFNNEVKYGQYGSKPALIHYFQSLGPVVPVDFQAAVREIINQHCRTLCQDHEEEVEAQKGDRIKEEEFILRNTGWRKRLDLPSDQLEAASRATELSFVQVGLNMFTLVEPPPEFTWEYNSALAALTTNTHRRLTAADARREMRGLTREQLSTISDIAKEVGALDSLGDALRGWMSPPQFSGMHGSALRALTTNTHRRLTATAAVREVQGLTRDDRLCAIRAISEKIGALDGLGDALRAWVHPDGFTNQHNYALYALTTHTDPGRRLTAAAAIVEIQDLIDEQLKTVIDISEQIGVLDGLGDALRAWVCPPEFSWEQREAITALTTHEDPKCRLTADAATAEIRELTDERLLALIDISEKIGALDGLGDALRAWVSPPEFSCEHKEALTILTTNENLDRRFTAERAMAEISGMSSEQALRVVRGESREQIFQPLTGMSPGGI